MEVPFLGDNDNFLELIVLLVLDFGGLSVLRRKFRIDSSARFHHRP